MMNSSRRRRAAGYAKPMSAEYQAKQAELIANHIKTQDIVITTALIPGRPAPKLITRAMIESMKPGSVIVDLAAERGGNTELTEPGKTIETPNGVKIYAPLNLAGTIAGQRLEPLCQEPFGLPRYDDRQKRKDAGGQLGRRSDQGHADRQGRPHRPSESRNEDP